MHALFGREFEPFPLFKPRNSSEFKGAWVNRATLLTDAKDYVMDAWVSSVAQVNPKMKAFEQVGMLTETLYYDPTSSLGTPPSMRMEPIQFPYRPDDRWLGTAFDSNLPIDGDKLSVVLNHSGTLDLTLPFSGIMIDDWVEKIPNPQETTGIAFGYDEPDTEPPQSLLLAVTPEITGNWSWNDLFDTVNETIDLSRKRGMEPSLFGNTAYGQLLPAIVSAVSFQDNATISLDYRNNVLDL